MRKLVVLMLALIVMLVPCAAYGEQEEPKPDDVKRVERLICAIGEVSFEREKYITDAEQAYAALLEADKDLVENAADLRAAREAFDGLLQREADRVMEAIAAIGQVDIEKADQIAAADAAYDALPEAAKALVTNHKELLDARFSLSVKEYVSTAQKHGETVVEINGVKVSYLVDEDRWAVVENEITEEYEPGDLAYMSFPITWNGYYRMITELPTGWSGKWYTAGLNNGALCTNKEQSMAIYYWARLLEGREDLLALGDPYQILEAVAKEAFNNQERGEFHRSIYAQRRALWVRANMDGTDSLYIFMLVDNKAIFCVQVWRPNASLSKLLIGIAVHSLNHMTITAVD